MSEQVNREMKPIRISGDNLRFHVGDEPVNVKGDQFYTASEYDTLLSRLDALRAGLEKLVELYALPGESNVERFERVAELFYRDTGCIAPGKDVAAASGGSMTQVERVTRWENWYADRAAKARALLEQRT